MVLGDCEVCRGTEGDSRVRTRGVCTRVVNKYEERFECGVSCVSTVGVRVRKGIPGVCEFRKGIPACKVLSSGVGRETRVRDLIPLTPRRTIVLHPFDPT